MRVVWTRPAGEQFAETLAFLAERSPAAASRLATEVETRLDQLAGSPYIGRPGRVEGTRELVLTDVPYIVAYRVTGRVEILAVTHGARRWPETFGI